ncbi:MAG: hypothetical protein WC346_15065 [Methanogenium sp.]|jgi:hypothetical protein
MVRKRKRKILCLKIGKQWFQIDEDGRIKKGDKFLSDWLIEGFGYEEMECISFKNDDYSLSDIIGFYAFANLKRCKVKLGKGGITDAYWINEDAYGTNKGTKYSSKESFIEDIMKHISRCYKPQSEMYKNVKKSLLKLSSKDINNLSTMIKTSLNCEE